VFQVIKCEVFVLTAIVTIVRTVILVSSFVLRMS